MNNKTTKNLNNRLHNATNPYQGNATRVLCLCSAGLLRSPTAANVLHENLGYNTRAAGTSLDFALIPVDEVLVKWADEIVCMSSKQADYVLDNFGEHLQGTRLYNLNIPDIFAYGDPELKELILKSYLEAEEITGEVN